MQILRLRPGAVLKDGGGGAARPAMTGQRILVTTQVSASLVMLSAAAMIYSAFHRVLAAHEGFDPGALVDARVSLVDTTGEVAIFREVLARVATDPGTDGATLAATIPPFQWSGTALLFRQGEEPPPGSSAERRAAAGIRANTIRISESFFDVMRIPIVRGRGFALASDTLTSEPSAGLRRPLANALWPRQNPIGRLV